MAADVLYVTFDGVLQPLGFSQVVRVVAGLGRRGFRYHLLSLERTVDLGRADLRRQVDDRLAAAGVGWTPLPVGPFGSARGVATTLARVVARAAAIARREGIRLVHARGYHGAAAGLALRRLIGVPYLFDARGYWIEERTGPGGRFSTPTAYALGKRIEQALFRGARGVVTLTELQALDVASGIFGPPKSLLRVIPTCADYEAFHFRESRPAKPDGTAAVPAEIQRTLGDKLVLGVVGALNETYFVAETLALARLAAQMSPAVHVLVLSAQRDAYQAALASAGLAADRYTIATADHWTMPDWLQWIDWGLLLVPETAANRAKMPTKLAEFFATGVRPLFYGCNSDAARWIERAGSGHVLGGVDAGSLRAAARHLVDTRADGPRLRHAREVTATHFSLAAGLDRYAEVVSGCLTGADDLSAAPPGTVARRGVSEDLERSVPRRDPGDARARD